jgi:flagellar hook-associated protein 3 FlgL
MTSVPRISFLGATRAAQSRLRLATARMDKANEQVSNGKAFSRPSEAPAAAARSAVLKDQLDQLDVYSSTVDDARSRLSIADTKMQQASALYHRITELATESASSTSSPSARTAVREEVVQIRDELQSIANSQYLGKPLFAGFQPGNAVTNTGAGWVFAGTPADQVQRRIAPGETVTANITAGELFANGTTNVFQELDNLASALASNNTAGIQATIDPINSLLTTLVSGQARLGAAANRVEEASSRNASIKVTLTTELSQVQDVDMADALTNQSRLTIAYQAALGVTAKANQQTLLDYWH